MKVPAHEDNASLHIIPLENNGEFKENGKDCTRVPFVNWNLQLNYWKQNLKDTKAKILVIDTLTSFAQLEKGEGFDAGVIASKMTQLKQAVAAINRDIAIVIIHHTRKEQDGHIDFDSIANSFMLRAATDCNMIFRLAGKKNPKQRLLKVESRLASEYELTLELDDNMGYKVVPDRASSAGDEAEVDEEAAIWNACQAHPEYEELGEKKLGRTLQISHNQVNRFRKRYGPRYFTNARKNGTLESLTPPGEFPRKAK